MSKYVIGIDYGTESGRVLLADVSRGKEAAVHIVRYPHGVITSVLPDTGVKLKRDWALQHPGDYLLVLKEGIPAVLQASGVNSDDVIGIGIDFTSSTVLPVDESGVPLCFKEELSRQPHSWVKLWKHHAAEAEAVRITELAALRGEPFLQRYGGKISSEWMLPKILQLLNDAPDLYDRTDRFVEAADWVVYQLTGHWVRNRAGAGYKGMWHDGFPPADYLRELHPKLERVAETKLRGDVVAVDHKAGGLSPEIARQIGLRPGTAVAAGMVDAHAAVPGSGVYEPGVMVMVMGTSTCHMLMSPEEQFVQGVAGVVKDGIIPGYYGYEAGQAAVGDLFGWFVQNGVPPLSGSIDGEEPESVHERLEREAGSYRPGETGLVALDWWNGNRSVLMDAELTGMLVGYTLSTRPAEIYRALLEATAFGTRKIIDTFEENGIEVNELYAAGGLPMRNRLLMQIYADVTGRTIQVPLSNETGALGAAMCGAVAASAAEGGYDTMEDAIRNMAAGKTEVYTPIAEHRPVYDKLYEIYLKLHDHFGKEAMGIMKDLKTLSRAAEEG
ncbi:ribulokinase [Paenibacillus sp. J2TS4]|uniref:ribulokinase n=1 Tax=Paenibacillus sp. J2TS4 TaxID=2807194 RepID=UPI001B120921|nr:ribulokinase [Paenibacillus sp. J2TS4]GIP35197.1 ribulokinase [Paenibacillus sp. J2TS4]